MQNQSRAEGDKRSRLRFALVGPGRVGSALAAWLTASGAELLRLSGRRRPDQASTAASIAPWVHLDELRSDDLDLLLLAVPDGVLEETARRLARRPQAKVALHVAGQFGAGILAPLRAAGCAVGSVHPLRAFPAQEPPADGVGTWFAVDGDPAAETLAIALAERIGGSWGRVAEADRPLYHLAATVAAGGVATLIAVVEELAQAAGLPPRVLGAYLGLTRGALRPIETSGGPVGPLITGPAARKDGVTLERQRAVLEASAPHLLPLIGRLQEETLRQCVRGAEIPEGVSVKIPPPADGKRE